jgi:hypothetical protein
MRDEEAESSGTVFYGAKLKNLALNFIGIITTMKPKMEFLWKWMYKTLKMRTINFSS